MKLTELADGRGGLSVEVRPEADVIEPRYSPGVADEALALRAPGSGASVRDRLPRGACLCARLAAAGNGATLAFLTRGLQTNPYIRG